LKKSVIFKLLFVDTLLYVVTDLLLVSIENVFVQQDDIDFLVTTNTISKYCWIEN